MKRTNNGLITARLLCTFSVSFEPPVKTEKPSGPAAYSARFCFARDRLLTEFCASAA
jgi:hypothetical protein